MGTMENVIYDMRFMLTMVAMAMVLTMVAMGVDLAFGWRKAKERGDAHTSYAFSRTITKFVLYEGSIIVGGCIDTLLHFGLTFYGVRYAAPLVAFFMAIVLCATEIWSMREKADEKTRNRINQAATMLVKAIGKEQLAKMIAEAAAVGGAETKE